METDLPGLARCTSVLDFEASCDRIAAALAALGFAPVFSVDHAAAAARAGLVMPPTRVLFFGNPAAGTPLMLAHPNLAIDLPVRILVAQDGQAQVSASWNTPEFLQHRHGLEHAALASLGEAIRKALAA